MTKNPVTIPHDTLAVKALRIMNDKKITSLCVHKKKNEYYYWFDSYTSFT